MAPTGCVDEDSLVSTDEGLRSIKDLDNTGAEFEQWGEIDEGVTTDGGTKTATAVYDNGFADVRRLETEGGFSVAATPNHRFRTLTQEAEYTWKEADSFEPGDRIVLQRNTFDSSSRARLDTSERDSFHHNTDESLVLPEEMSPELAEFLGYFMGDGYVHEGVGVKLVVESDAEKLDEYLRDLGESVFGVTPTVERRDTRHILTFGGRHLPRYFENNGWKKDDGNRGEGAATAFVPDEVLSSDEDCAKAFLRGLFEADGTASRKVELSTVSETLADEVQTVLLSLGCVFVQDVLETEERDDHYGDRPQYTVRGANKREDKRFLEEIGFITKTTEIELTSQSYKNDTYPPAVVEHLRSLDGYEEIREETKHRVNQSVINGSVSRKLVRDVEKETGETVRVDGRRLTDFYAAPVESVTEEVAYTKDISVPSNNTYVANGFVTHNTTSMIGNTTGGCEPIYNVAYYKNVSDDVQGDEMLVEFDDYFLRTLEENDIDVDEVKEEAKEQMSNNDFDGIDGLSTVPDEISSLFVTTQDLTGKEHASVQCALQDGVDSSISKTCNFPNDATVDEMEEVYRYIYENGGKGVTVYRDGTRSKQVLTTRADNKLGSDADNDALIQELRDRVETGEIDSEEVIEEIAATDSTEVEIRETETDSISAGEREPRPRPDTIQGTTQKIDTSYGGLYVTINEDDEGMFEVFTQIGKSGGYTASFTEAIARLLSLCLRSGIPAEQVIDQLEGIRSPKVSWDRGEQIHSVPDAIAKAMQRHRNDEIDVSPVQSQLPVEEEKEDEETEETEETEAETDDSGRSDFEQLVQNGMNPECPDCGSQLTYSEGCVKCEECGYSEC
ncbi:MAG: LAGLIDADG family homing endonuclease [Halobacteria archaeon]|nr:LAGLIDADG family homing endonuclease [Halobacteria archaeon]